MNWTAALELAKKDQEKFINKGERIVKRYRDERGDISGEISDVAGSGKKYNILWSNVKTMFPAVYAKKPQAQVERRYKDKDPVARTASQILERALQYEIDQYSDYDAALRGAVLDRLLPGRGVAWVRFEQGDQITDDVQSPVKRKLECTPTDYVFWKDFRHSPARTWEEVTWVARLVYMTDEEGEARFKDAWKNIPLTHEPVGLDQMDATVSGDAEKMKKAKVWEIWDKTSMTVCWKAEGVADPLDEVDDPLGLEGFFPCPKPLFATTTTDTLVPIADYLEYQDQAIELDELTQRIGMLVKAVKVVGVYDASQTGVERMMNEGTDNTLIPVNTWAAFGEKGGLKGVVDFLPLDMVITALNELYKARDITKQVVYEITGMSDIIRGASVASETATAQQIKSQYASLRLKETQQDVARFAGDILNMKAQIMCDLYQPQTLAEMSGIMLTDDAQYAEEAIQLLKSEALRNYRIEIASDSMVELDEQAEKQSRMEFLTAVGGFLKEAVQAPPELQPLLGEMLLFGARSFKAGRSMESALEQFIQQASQPKPPQPNPEQMKMQAEQQQAAAKMQSDQAIAQAQGQAKIQIATAQAQAQQQTDMLRQQMEERQHQSELDMKARMDAMQARFDEQEHMRDQQFEQWKVIKQAETQLAVAEISKATTLSPEQNQAADNAASD